MSSEEKLTVGPHILVRERVDVDNAYFNGKPHEYRWRCKYCNESWALPDAQRFTHGDCDGFENYGVLKETIPDVELK